MNVSIKRAAELLGLSQLSVRMCLQKGILPIGTAWKNKDSNKSYCYYINPHLLAEYLGMEESEI